MRIYKHGAVLKKNKLMALIIYITFAEALIMI
jgi:hypothetical protein